MARKKQTARERGYFPRAEAAKSLRDLADRLEQPNDGSLVKFSLNVWATPDDEPESKDTKCPDCKHDPHEPSRCSQCNCGQSEISHAKTPYKTATDKVGPRGLGSSLRPTHDAGRRVPKRKTD